MNQYVQIPCPYCGKAPTKATSTVCKDGDVRRQRKCDHCDRYTTTYEVSAIDYAALKAARKLKCDVVL